MKLLIAPFNNISKRDAAEWNVDEIILPTELDCISLFGLKETELTIFVPTIINPEIAFEYDGAHFAMHLYMQALQNELLTCRVIMAGIESRESFLLNFRYPNFLKCPGIEYIQLNLEAIVEYSAGMISIDKSEALRALINVGIKLPDSYVSNHSFVNEWCSYKWSEYVGLHIDELSKCIQSNLYLDYLHTLYHDSHDLIADSKKAEIAKLEGRILLIDDSVYWHTFWNHFFNNSAVKFHSIGHEFKFMTVKAIICECQNVVESFKPDIILLDFRLLDDKDYDVHSRTEISGIQVLRAMKGTSDDPGPCFGSRIVMFTATKQIDHILAMQKFGADAFILKDSPERYVGKLSTKGSISKIIQVLNQMHTCAIFSVPICESLNQCLYIAKSVKRSSDDFYSQLHQIVATIRILLHGDFYDRLKLKAIYIECFGILELIKRVYEPHTMHINDFIKNNFSTLANWNNIKNLRNALAHGHDVVEIDNQKDTPINEALIGRLLLDLGKFNVNFMNNYFSR